MAERVRIARDHKIAELVIGCPQTAAAHLPMVMWTDYIDRDILYASAEVARQRRQENREGLSPIYRHNDFCSLYLVSQGRGTHVIEGVPYGIARGDVYTMGVGMEHFFVGCEHLQLETIHFTAQVFDTATLDTLIAIPGFEAFFLAGALHPMTEQLSADHWLHLAPDDYIQVHQMMGELKAEWEQNSIESVLLTRCLFLRLLVQLARLHQTHQQPTHWHAPPPKARGEAMIAAAVRYMDAHFTEPIHIQDIARMVFLSHDRFTAVFTAVMGRTPRDYLHHLRLERAKTLLRTTDLSVTDIAQEAGFSEAAYFIRVFRQEVGQTPGAYRK